MDSDEIKRSISMRELVESYGIKVNSKGFCKCPFHEERTPSMKIYKDSYHCFGGCGASGDIFSFVQAYEGISFKEAYKRLGGSYRQVNSLRDKLLADKEKQKRKAFKREKEREMNRLKVEKRACLIKITALKELKTEVEEGSLAWHYCENEILQNIDRLKELTEKGVRLYE